MGILDFIQRARKAQQDNPQKHDVQLELKTDGPYRITVIPPAPLALVTEYEWPTEDEIAERRWSELEALWEDYDLSREVGTEGTAEYVERPYAGLWLFTPKEEN